MKKIFFKNSDKYTLVNDDVYLSLNKEEWLLDSRGYACRYEYDKETKQNNCILMHRVIMNVIDPDVFVDHRDGDRINNLRKNLRKCNHGQNSKNRKKHIKSSCKYKGLTKRKYSYEAKLVSDNESIYIGSFSNEIAAANAYNYYAKVYHGEFANLNDCPFMEKEEWESFKTKITKTSKYKGVHLSKKNNKWESGIYFNKKQKFLGYFSTEKEAVIARNDFILNNNLNTNLLQQV